MIWRQIEILIKVNARAIRDGRLDIGGENLVEILVKMEIISRGSSQWGEWGTLLSSIVVLFIGRVRLGFGIYVNCCEPRQKLPNAFWQLIPAPGFSVEKCRDLCNGKHCGLQLALLLEKSRYVCYMHACIWISSMKWRVGADWLSQDRNNTYVCCSLQFVWMDGGSSSETCSRFWMDGKR